MVGTTPATERARSDAAAPRSGVGSPLDSAPRTAAATHRYRIDSRRRWFPDLGEVMASRDLLVLLSKRQITVTYRQTVLGAAWVFISPLLSAGLFTFVFGKVANLSSGGVGYFAFSYAGLLGWNLFAATLQGTATSLTANSALISKIYFSRLILPLSTLAATFIELVISAVIMAVMIAAYQIGITIHLLLLPVWLLMALLLAVGAGLILTAVSVAYRDVNNVTPTLVSLLLYLTPVAYSTNEVPHSLREAFLINPVATVVEGCRWSLIGKGYLTPWTITYASVMTVVAIVVGLVAFARLERSFADVI